ncbi:deoxyribose-phosphate aldolase [candidate division WOR-3 bacterium]|nr:deoxyribose-phosphate aldolase [candidate division WOR-3 bacterium]
MENKENGNVSKGLSFLLNNVKILGIDRVGTNGKDSENYKEIGSIIDHTLLKPDATESDIKRVCEEALIYGFASVCVNPYWTKLVSRLLRNSSAKTCTVIGFPLGANVPDVKAFETRNAIINGAEEVDMVINIGALKSEQYDKVKADIEGVVKASGPLVKVKVILETSYLTDEEKIKASVLAMEAGADFVKTSTGFGPAGATARDVALMRKVVDGYLGVKAAGGIHSYEEAVEMIEAGATRIGASASIEIVRKQG